MSRKEKAAIPEERKGKENSTRPGSHLDARVSAEAWRVDSEAILESISDGVFTVDLQWRITSFNRAAEQITGVGRAEAIGRLCWEVFRASLCES
ncbi:MAG: PAS domain-containing protein, partial [Calditrichaeota bacterium]|nr:PAS domain-containing protein [Calditrichota bacterium]